MPCSDFCLPGIIDVSTGVTWDDLVLPEPCIKKLQEYMFWVEHRCKVQVEWGAKISGGPIALFSGPYGTGKTLTAEALANTLQLPLYRVDLSGLVGKYIGETEKNMNALFDAVTNEPMLLLFDDVDSLFTKRNEVQDYHDPYAGLKTSYLLSRLKRYKGPSILTTNLRNDIDPEFLRRFQMIIDFPFPDAIARSKLWQLHIPSGAPINEDIDLDHLAREMELTGGQIHNVTLHAAFLAAGESTAISSKHITSAIRNELSRTVKS